MTPSYPFTLRATDLAGAFSESQGVVQVATPAPPGVAELPRAYVNTAYVAPTGTTHNVAAGGNLQAALNAAQPGDRVLLAAGATFSGNFTLPVKSGTGTPIVVTTDTTLPPEGTRVTPATAAGFAKIITPNAGAAIETVGATKKWRLMGLEVGAAAGLTSGFSLVRVGDGTTVADPLQQARDIIIDRCYIHGHNTLHLRRCVELNGAASAVIDSYLSEAHASGFDAQAILTYNTPGPLKIVNNYLEGSGENFMSGGADPMAASMIPADIEFARNDVVKPASWYGSPWGGAVKNLFEIKTAVRVLVEHNVFDGSWSGGQFGYAFVLKSANEGAGFGTWSYTADLTIRRNTIRNARGAFDLLAIQINEPGASPVSRVVIEDNLMENMGHESPYSPGQGGRLYQIINDVKNLVIQHNTYMGSGLWNQVVFEGGGKTGFVFKNNIIGPADYGFQNAASLNSLAPGAIVTGNILGPAGFNNALPPGNCLVWPPPQAACANAGVRP